MMRAAVRSFIIISISILIAAPLLASEPGAIHLRYIEGSVQYLPAGTQRWLPAAVNTPLAEGEALKVTSPGNAELFMRDGSLLRIAKGSQLKVLSIERSAIQFYIESGRAYVNFRGLKGYPIFLNTSSAQLDVLERAIFRVDVDTKGNTEISVIAGELYVAQPKGKMKIIAGTRLVMNKDGNRPLYTKTRPADEWERWNRARDSETQPTPSQGQRYVPEGPPAYPADPDGGGQWVATGGYVYLESAPVYGYYYPGYWRTYPYGGWYGPYYRGYVGPRYWYGGPRYRGWGPYRGGHGPGRGYHGRPYRR